MSARWTCITGLWHSAVCVVLGAALVLLVAADVPRGESVVPGHDAAAQRLRIHEELVALNARMDELLRLLTSGNLKVICVGADSDGRGPDHDGRTYKPEQSRGAREAPLPGLHAR